MKILAWIAGIICGVTVASVVLAIILPIAAAIPPGGWDIIGAIIYLVENYA